MTSSKCPIEKIVKRDGNIVDYNRERIATAIFKAAAEVGGRDREMAEFLATQGVDQGAFLKAYNSFGVKAQVEKAKKLAAAYQISGVPVLVVNGKYRFDIGSAGGPEQTVDLADQLIDKERSAQ